MSRSDWRWLLARGVHLPAASRLALESAARRLPGARLLTARVPGSEAWVDSFRKEHLIRATAQRVVPVRAVPAGCLLVRKDVLAAHGLPPARGRFGGDLAWSARVLRDGGGYLLPGVVVERDASVPGRCGEAAGLGRLLVAPGLMARERLWLSYLLARRVAGARP